MSKNIMVCCKYNPPNGSMGRHVSWKNHELSACWCVTTLLEADSRLLICRIAPSQKGIRETRDFYFLLHPCLPIEPLGGLDFLATFENFEENLKHKNRCLTRTHSPGMGPAVSWVSAVSGALSDYQVYSSRSRPKSRRLLWSHKFCWMENIYI